MIIEDPPTGSDQHQDTLLATLSFFSLKEAPPFGAVSYEWGQDAPTRIIELRTGPEEEYTPLRVTPNCFSMITHIHRQYGSMYLWIDAICVNQSCTNDKRIQVSIMGHIFTRGHRTFVWLGESDATCRAMEELSRAWRLEPADRSIITTSWRLRLAMALLRHYIFALLYHRSWSFSGQGSGLSPLLVRLALRTARFDEHAVQHLHNLLNNTWRSRAWTLQELILAREPVLICRDQVVTWANFVVALGYLKMLIDRESPQITPELGIALSVWQSLAATWAIVDWFRRHRDPASPEISFWSKDGRKKETTITKQASTLRAVGKQLVFSARVIASAINIAFRWFAYFFLVSVTRLLLQSILILGVRFTQCVAILIWLIFNLAWPALVLYVLFGFPATLIWLGNKKGSFWPMLIGVIFYLVEWCIVFGRVPRFSQCIAFGFHCSEHPAHNILSWSVPRPDLRMSRDTVWPTALEESQLRMIAHYDKPLPREVITPPEVMHKQGIVEALRSREATEPRDKAYALHSILTMAHVEVQDVDYQRPIWRSIVNS